MLRAKQALEQREVSAPREVGVDGNVRGCRPADVERYSQCLGLSYTVASWLLRAGHADEELARRFLEPKLSELTQPSGMLGRDIAAERLAQAVRRGERIVVFGDYDCDGMTATAILTEVLRTVGGRVYPLLANRFDGGYGISERALERIRQREPSLVVTCDCGSSDHPRLGQLTASGIDVIVIDHHLVPEETLPVLAFLNPHQPGCEFPFKGMASCGLVFSIAAALRKRLGVELDIRRWLDLVALGTIADVAPLQGDNRALVRGGLALISRGQRPGMRALLELAKIEPGTPLCSRDIAFRLAPHLNAPGRLGAPDLALELLMALDGARANELAVRLREVSDERRQQQQRILEQAQAQIEQQAYRGQAALVLGQRGWNPGVVGIVAGRLADEYQVPVVVVGFDAESPIGSGSVRGPRGARLHDALSRCAAHVVRFGGHQAAAGVTLEFGQLDAFREVFVQAIQDQAPEPYASAAEDWPFDERDTPLAVWNDLSRLEPCGEGNPRPKLRVRGSVRRAREVSGGHLKLELSLPRGQRLDCFGVGFGAMAASLPGTVEVVGDLRYNSFPHGEPVELFAEGVLPLEA